VSESSEPASGATAIKTTCEASVVLPADLHARPAGALVQAAAKFVSTVEISYKDKTANARGVLAVMALGARKGETVVLRAAGGDAEDAARTLAEVLAAAD
jgi:phosphotransferase system HPr (HPr) family protein